MQVKHLLLEKMLTHFLAHGLLKARGRQRTDSTHVLAAIRTLNRLELVAETLVHTLNVLATIAPDWLKSQVPVEWFSRYEKRLDEYRLPKGKSEQKILVFGSGNPALKKVIPVSQHVSWKDGGELILDYKGFEHNNGNVEVKMTLKVFAETISRDAVLQMGLDDQDFIVSFGPHGITFSQPALLNIEAKNLDLSGVNPETVALYYLDSKKGDWEKMDTVEIIVNLEQGYLKFVDSQIHHFSRYALAWSN